MCDFSTFATSARKIAGSVPEKSVGEPINKRPFSVINVVIFACGLNGHLATPLSNFVTFKLSIWKLIDLVSALLSSYQFEKHSKDICFYFLLFLGSSFDVVANLPDAMSTVGWMHVFHKHTIDFRNFVIPLHSYDNRCHWHPLLCTFQQLLHLLPMYFFPGCPKWRRADTVHLCKW